MNTSSTPIPSTAVASPTPLGIRIRSALFEIAAQEPNQAPRMVLWTVAAMVALLILWAAFSQVDVVAVAPGRLVPQTYVKIVQPSAAGIVRDILVKEGDEVVAGQVLVRLDPTENGADSIAVVRELAIEKLQMRRIGAELKGAPLILQADDDPQLFAQTEAQRLAHRQAYLDAVSQAQAVRDRAEKELAAANEVLKKLERILPSYQRSAEAYEKLAKDKLVGELQAEEARRSAIQTAQDLEAQKSTVESLQATVTETNRKLQQLHSSYQSDLHATRINSISHITQLEQQQTKVVFQQANLELKAPQAGKVKELATTTVGAVVQPGTVLVSLVPENEPLSAEVMVNNEDIGFIKPGQPVRMKLSTYPFQQYGMLDGVVKTVIADSQTQSTSNNLNARSTSNNSVNPNGTESGAPSTMTFKAVVELNTQSLNVQQEKFPLAAGMQLNAEIIEGKRTVLEYLLSPVRRIVSESGTER